MSNNLSLEELAEILNDSTNIELVSEYYDSDAGPICHPYNCDSSLDEESGEFELIAERSNIENSAAVAEEEIFETNKFEEAACCHQNTNNRKCKRKMKVTDDKPSNRWVLVGELKDFKQIIFNPDKEDVGINRNLVDTIAERIHELFVTYDVLK